MPVRLCGEHHLGRDQPAIKKHRRGAGLAGLGAEAHAEESFTPQHPEQ